MYEQIPKEQEKIIDNLMTNQKNEVSTCNIKHNGDDVFALKTVDEVISYLTEKTTEELNTVLA